MIMGIGQIQELMLTQYYLAIYKVLIFAFYQESTIVAAGAITGKKNHCSHLS